jgi:hypothetical protein
MRVTLDKGPPMQSTQMPKIQQEIDPHDVLAIEQALAAHAHRAPPLVHDPAATPAAPEAQIVQAPGVQAPVVQTQTAPEISIDKPSLQVDATYRAPAAGEMQLEDVRPGDLKAPGDRPTAKWTKGVLMAGLGLCGAIAAAGWQHYGDQAKATALGWAPPFVASALDSSEKPATAAQEGAPVIQAAADQAAAQPAPPTAPVQPATATPVAPSADAAQLQSMAQDLAAMSQQVEELKANIAQLKASQAQLIAARNSEVKPSEAKVSEAKPLDQSMRPKLTAAAAPSPARPAAAPVRKPKPPAYPPAQAAYIPPPPVAAAAPPPAPPPPAIADDGQPVVRPPMPLR